MTRKRSSPSLYELMKDPRIDGDDVDDGETLLVETIDEEPETDHWLSPGRAMALPVGYLLVAAAGALVVVILAYMIGYERGEQRARDDLEARWLAGDAPVDGGVPPGRDPLTFQDQPGGGVLGTPERGGDRVVEPFPTSPPVGPAPTDAATWGLVESDPRQDGYRYFVLMNTQREGALRLAQYCRDNGLAAYVVRKHKSQTLHQVIALPGFNVPTTDPAVVALRDQIHEIGARWKRHEDGVTDLHDAYPQSHPP